jgi:hypothetical protein
MVSDDPIIESAPSALTRRDVIPHLIDVVEITVKCLEWSFR